MVRKGNAQPEPEAGTVVEAQHRSIGSIVITPKDRIAFDTCVEVTGCQGQRSKVAYFEVGGNGIIARGRKLGWVHCAWQAENP